MQINVMKDNSKVNRIFLFNINNMIKEKINKKTLILLLASNVPIKNNIVIKNKTFLLLLKKK